MIIRMLLMVVVVVCGVMGQENWNGFNDTASIVGWDSLEVRYSKAFTLTRYEDIAVVVKVNDTSSAGFAGDSVSGVYGYQLGYPVLNSLGKRDTLWWPKDTGIILDTFDLTDSAGVAKGKGVSGADGSVTDYLGGIDTSEISGYATQASWFIPKWAPAIRFFVYGLAGNRTVGNKIVWIFDVKRRLRTVVTE
jgi:hypothetical protein